VPGVNVVDTASLQAGSVTGPKIAAGAVTGPKIAAGTITEANIAPATITAASLADGAVTNPKLATGSVTAAKIGANAVTNAAIADNSINATKLINPVVYVVNGTTIGSGYYWQENTVSRWNMLSNNATESGSNTGSDLEIQRFTDAGAYLGSPIYISRATGKVTLANDLTIANFSNLWMTGAAGNNLQIIGARPGGAPGVRWIITPGDNGAESGSNAGSDFRIGRFSDTGTYIDQPLSIKRSDGSIRTGYALTVVGAGALPPFLSMDDTVNQGALLRFLKNAQSTHTLAVQTNGILQEQVFNNGGGTLLGVGFQISPTGPTFGSPITYANTNAAAANIVIDSNGWLYRSTSSLRYKEAVRDYQPPPDVIDRLRPVSFQTLGDEAESPLRYVGFIAEEVDAAGLKEFVGYDPEGRPDELHYAHLTALIVAELQALRRRVAELEAAH
jgi:hypothetical protein